jgi:hypothetical protein
MLSILCTRKVTTNIRGHVLASHAMAKLHQSAARTTISVRGSKGRPKADPEKIREVTEILSTYAGIDVCDIR